MSTLFAYPKNAAFGRVLPKNKVYQHSGLSRKMQAAFVDQIDQINWAFKLAPETTNLPATTQVSEIQLFRVRLRTREISEGTLSAIDKAVAFPIIFELMHGDHVRVMAAHKRPSDADSAKWVISPYLAGEWVAADSERQALPVALNMGALYEGLLAPMMPAAVKEALAADAKPDLRQQMERVEALKSKEAQIAKMEARLAREKQFNRKVEINARLREERAVYNAMADKPVGKTESDE